MSNVDDSNTSWQIPTKCGQTYTKIDFCQRVHKFLNKVYRF